VPGHGVTIPVDERLLRASHGVATALTEGVLLLDVMLERVRAEQASHLKNNTPRDPLAGSFGNPGVSPHLPI
jgi:hypothetical protein